jgi:hypothetical protein
MKNPSAILITVSLGLCCFSSVSFSAADRAATEKTKTVLSYLESLPSRPDKRVISGQHDEGDYSVLENIYRKSGKYPCLLGVDYQLQKDPGFTSGVIIRHSNSGGLVTLSYHMNNPLTEKNAWDTAFVDFNKLVTSGTSLNNTLNSRLDGFASYAKVLQDSGVTVLFRPFHEMNRSHFWWGGKKPKEFKALWMYVFNYLTVKKQVHNLLWVYTPMSGDNVLDFYPGPGYVDIVGLDYYGEFDLPKMTMGLENYKQLTGLGKPFSLAEFGPCPAAGSGCPDIDYSLLIEGIRQNMPKTVYWLSWDGQWGMDRHLNITQLLDDPWVVTRGELAYSSAPGSRKPAVRLMGKELKDLNAFIDTVNTSVFLRMNMPADGNITMLFNNPLEQPVSGRAEMQARKSGWEVTPPSKEFTAGPLGKTVVSFKVKLDNPEDVYYPTPSFICSFSYPGTAKKYEILRDVVLDYGYGVKKTEKPPVIDADLAEWGGTPDIILKSGSHVVSDNGKKTEWSGPEDLSADIFMRWDDKNLYLAAKVHDADFYQPFLKGDVWEGDGIQLAFDADGDRGWELDSDDYELGFSLTKDGPETWCWRAGGDKSKAGAWDIPFKASRKDNLTCYEIALPWEKLSANPGSTCGFTILFNDNDGKGRKGWMELTPGIGKDKHPVYYAKLTFVN